MNLKKAMAGLSYCLAAFGLGLGWMGGLPSAEATITIQNITGASNQRFRTTQDDPTTVVTPTIYGGTGGSTGSCPSPNELCDTCADLTPPTYAVCNERRIQPGLDLRIEFSSDSIPAGETGFAALLRPGADNTEIRVENVNISSGQIATLTVPWSRICEILPEESQRDANCSFSFNRRARLGFLKPGDSSSFIDSVEINFIVHSPSEAFAATCPGDGSSGICDFAVFPGDEKVFITDLRRGSLFPNAPGARISHLRILFSDSDFNMAVGSSTRIAVLDGDREGQNFLANKSIDGFVNGTRYYFRVATEDIAGNIFNFTPTALITATCPDPSDPSCPYAATPDEVFGLLTDDLNCFVSTAAFGSALHPKVQDFRLFRDQVLLHLPWGHQLVESYYRQGPYAARWLHKNSQWKPLIRALLWPLWLGSKSTVQVQRFLPRSLGFNSPKPLIALSVVFMAFALALLAPAVLLIAHFKRRRQRGRHLSPALFMALIWIGSGVTLSYSPFLETEEWGGLIEEDSSAIPQSQSLHDPRETRRIRHPDAKKGLTRITREGVYEYRVEPSEQTKSASVRFGFFEPTELANPSTGTFYSDIYDDTQAATLLFDYDWRQWHSGLGRASLSFGSGLFFSSGRGRFASPPNIRALEEFTFVAMPHNISFNYRLQFVDRQVLVPYASAGPILFTFAEFRDDQSLPKAGGVFAAQVSAGASLSLAWLDRRSMQNMDRDFGVNDIKLTFEFRQIIGLNENFDFTGALINGGISADF